MKVVKVKKYICLSVLGSALWMLPAEAAIMGGIGIGNAAAACGMAESDTGAVSRQIAQMTLDSAFGAVDPIRSAGAYDSMDCTGGGVDSMRKCLRQQMLKEAESKKDSADDNARKVVLTIKDRQSIFEEKVRQRGRVVMEKRKEIGGYNDDTEAHLLSQWAKDEVAILRHNLPEDNGPEALKRKKMFRESRSSMQNWALGNHDMMDAREEMRAETRDMRELLKEGRALSTERIASRHGG